QTCRVGHGHSVCFGPKSSPLYTLLSRLLSITAHTQSHTYTHAQTLHFSHSHTSSIASLCPAIGFHYCRQVTHTLFPSRSNCVRDRGRSNTPTNFLSSLPP